MWVTTVRYKEEHDWQTPIERHMKVEHKEATQMGHDWKEWIKIDLNFDAHCYRATGSSLNNDGFQSMCNDHLGHISVAEQSIELASNKTLPVHYVLSRARPISFQFERAKIDKKLEGTYWSGEDGMGYFYGAVSECRGMATLLCRLQEIKRHHCTQFLPNSKNRWMKRLSEWRTNILRTQCRTPLLASQPQFCKMWQNRSHFDSWPVKIVRNAISLAWCSWPIPTTNPYNITPYKFAICISASPQCYYTFQNADKRISHVCTVFSQLNKPGVTLTLKKCRFFIKKIRYLGHLLRPGGLEQSDYSADPIWDLKPPCKVAK